MVLHIRIKLLTFLAAPFDSLHEPGFANFQSIDFFDANVVIHNSSKILRMLNGASFSSGGGTFSSTRFIEFDNNGTGVIQINSTNCQSLQNGGSGFLIPFGTTSTLALFTINGWTELWSRSLHER